MNNNTQLVSVARDLLERLAHLLYMHDLEQTQAGMDLDIEIEKADESAAPAEDVRAVVEEPVSEIDPEARHLSVLALHDVMQSVPCSSLYSLAEAVLDAGYSKSQPQSPIVLPKRRPKTELGIYSLEDEGYNACLDVVEELNKC